MEIAAVDRYFLPAWSTAANAPHAAAVRERDTDRRTQWQI